MSEMQNQNINCWLCGSVLQNENEKEINKHLFECSDEKCESRVFGSYETNNWNTFEMNEEEKKEHDFDQYKLDIISKHVKKHNDIFNAVFELDARIEILKKEKEYLKNSMDQLSSDDMIWDDEET